MELTARDMEILKLVFRFRFCLGRHIRVLMKFNGQRATDRRLKVLFENGYLNRRKYLYGVPYLYTLSHKGRVLLGVNKRSEKIRIDRITHDILVLDTVIFYMEKNNLQLSDIRTVKELNILDGFGTRKHHPDFVISLLDKKIAVEIELHPKAKNRLEKNIRDNFLNYDQQIWITNNNKVINLIQDFSNDYSNIEIINLKEVLIYV